MAYGTAPDALVNELQSEWAATRAGRADIPDVVRDGSGDPSSDPRDGSGVLIIKNFDEVGVNRQIHDLIKIYHPEASPGSTTDNGYKEQDRTETVQIDIDLTDQTHYDPIERDSCETRMIGDRATLADVDEPPYGGILGEVQYILEPLWGGFQEWQRVSWEPLTVNLDNSNAFVALTVDLEQIARNIRRP